MPTHDSPSPAATMRDATEPGRDVPIPLLTHITNVVVSATDDAGPQTTWTRSGVDFLGRCWRALQARRQDRRSRVALCSLTERELSDIGVTSTEIDCIVARRTIERLRNGTAFPGMR
jgi:uncharacterized protein YjiS (DUF1127 family)